MFIISKFTVKTANADPETTLKATDSDLRLHPFTTLPLHRHNVITALLTFRCSKSELFNSPNSILPQCDCRADGY